MEKLMSKEIQKVSKFMTPNFSKRKMSTSIN